MIAEQEAGGPSATARQKQGGPKANLGAEWAGPNSDVNSLFLCERQRDKVLARICDGVDVGVFLWRGSQELVLG